MQRTALDVSAFFVHLLLPFHLIRIHSENEQSQSEIRCIALTRQGSLVMLYTRYFIKIVRALELSSFHCIIISVDQERRVQHKCYVINIGPVRHTIYSLIRLRLSNYRRQEIWCKDF